MNVPEAVGVPLIVMVFAAHDAVTPAGRFVGAPIPVAPVVVCVIAVSAVFTHKVGVDEGALAVLSGVTVIVIVLLVPVGLVTQVMLLVNTTSTASPLPKAASMYVALLLPTLIEFFFH